MASYEKAEALQTYVKKNLKKINDLIQDLPDISEFEDVIDDISDVSTYIGGLDSNTDKKVGDDIKKKIRYLSNYLSGIKENITNLKGNKVTLSPESITIESNAYTKSYAKENFLKDKFPIIPDWFLFWWIRFCFFLDDW